MTPTVPPPIQGPVNPCRQPQEADKPGRLPRSPTPLRAHGPEAPAGARGATAASGPCSHACRASTPGSSRGCLAQARARARPLAPRSSWSLARPTVATLCFALANRAPLRSVPLAARGQGAPTAPKELRVLTPWGREVPPCCTRQNALRSVGRLGPPSRERALERHRGQGRPPSTAPAETNGPAIAGSTCRSQS